MRVAALGKKGSISALLATLGKLTPDERRTHGAAINALKDQVTEALAARRAILQGRRARGPAQARGRVDVTLPVRLPGVETGRIHPLSQVMDEIVAIFADMGFAVAEGPDIESDDYNFTKLNFPPGHPAREMHDTFFLEPDAHGERKAPAHPYEPGAGAHDAEPEAADPRHLPGPHLSHRLRPDAHADVPSGRGPRHRRERDARQPQVGAGGILQGVLRSAARRHALPAELLPVHLALDGGRHPVPPLGRRDPLRRRRGLARNPRLRHGPPERADELRHRPGRLPGLRLGHGRRPGRHAQIRPAGPARLLRRRPALDQPLRLQAARRPGPS